MVEGGVGGIEEVGDGGIIGEVEERGKGRGGGGVEARV